MHPVNVNLEQGKDEDAAIANCGLKIEVSDTGVGIAAAELEQLLKAFIQTESGKNSQERTGLGLAIGRNFVQLMGGDIQVKSEVGHGTIFTFNINIEVVEAAEIEPQLETRNVIALKSGQPRYRILIVDDRPSNRILSVKLLQPLGFELQEASNSREAIQKWEEWKPHLIFMDMRMPLMDGYEATKSIKSQTKENPPAIVALTASRLEAEKAVILSAGCDNFIRNPFREATIFKAIERYLGIEYIYEEEPEPCQPQP